MLQRLISVAVLAACGAEPPIGARLPIQRANAEGLKVLAFDAHDAIGAMVRVQGGMPTTALALPGGDWIIGFDGHITARLSPEDTLRWTRELAIDHAVAAGGDRFVATTVVERRLTILGVRGDGHVAWKVDGGQALSQPRLVRTPDATIISRIDGELAVDDAGVVRWRIERPRSNSALAAYVGGAGVVIVQAAPAAPMTAFLERLRMPMIVRVIDPGTGKERARTELMPDGDAWSLADLAVVGKRVVVRAVDHEATPVHEIVVFTIGERATIALESRFTPSAVEELASVPRIGRDDAVFLGRRERRDPALLELTLVDPLTHRVRRAPVMQAPKASIQIRQRDAFTVIGNLDGSVVVGDQRLHADVRAVKDMNGQMKFAPLWFVGTYSPR